MWGESYHADNIQYSVIFFVDLAPDANWAHPAELYAVTPDEKVLRWNVQLPPHDDYELIELPNILQIPPPPQFQKTPR